MFVMVKLIHIGALRYTAMRSFVSLSRQQGGGPQEPIFAQWQSLHGRIEFGGKIFFD